MAYTKCAKCGVIAKNVKTVKEARSIAVLHYRMLDGSHLLTFGYEGEIEN